MAIYNFRIHFWFFPVDYPAYDYWEQGKQLGGLPRYYASNHRTHQFCGTRVLFDVPIQIS